jgi:3-keto-disaccharide hydrolase
MSLRHGMLYFSLILTAPLLLSAQAPQARQALASPAADAAPATQTPAAPAAPAGRGGGAPLEISTDLTGFIPMFNGVDLKGWDGPMPLWHVEDGAIVVRRTVDPPVGSVYLLWQGGQPKDFEMVFDVKLEGDGANSGVQFRAALLGEVPDREPVAGYPMTKWETHGYQADMTNMGGANNIIECCRGPRRGLQPRPDANASRGTVARSATVEGGPKNLLAYVEDTNTLSGYWKSNDWNTLRIIARGRTFIYICNNHVLSIMMDDSPTFYQDHGYIAIQLEGAAPNAAYFKNMWIKLLPD